MKPYHPEGLYVWDTWYYEEDGRVHVTFLQSARPGFEEKMARENPALGHAVTDDLVHWETCPTALYPGEAGSYDDVDLWTGCTVVHEGTKYMYYAANRMAEGGVKASIALATSRDGVHYTKHPENPVIRLEGSPYCTLEHPTPVWVHGWGHEDIRDLSVVRDEEAGLWYGYYAARIPADEGCRTTAIILCRSRDLVHWEDMGPCFLPERYACVEVPDVFFLDGKWWMILLTGDAYGQRRISGQRDWIQATIQACADSPTGPFTEVMGHELIGSTDREGFSARTVVRDGKRYFFYTQGEYRSSGSGLGTISFPTELRRVGDHLEAFWCDAMETQKAGLLYAMDGTTVRRHAGEWGTVGVWDADGDTVRGRTRFDGSYLPFGEKAADFVAEAEIIPGDCRAAGLMIRGGDTMLDKCYTVLLDAERGEIWCTVGRNFELLTRRTWTVTPGKPVHLRVLACAGSFQVFADDALVLQFHDATLTEGRCGYYVEAGSAEFRKGRVYALA